jgi:hypothetical protein
MTATETLIAFVLEHATEEPLQHRARVYRALCATLPIGHAARTMLTQAADELEAAEARTEQLLLNLRGGAR